MTFIAGPYTATYNGLALGQTEAGFELEASMEGEAIRGDQYGDLIQDAVYRLGNAFANATFIEFDAAALASLWWPHSNTPGQFGISGRLLSNMALPLVLTKVAGSNALYNTVTASRAIIALGFPVRFVLASNLRKVPARLALLPYTASGNTIAFTTT